MTTLRRQLAELGLEDRFGAVMEEVGLVRAELGYPIMVTPFPQMVIGQALPTCCRSRAGYARYDNVPDQVIRYVLGSFGKPTAPVEPWVLDRMLGRPRAAELAAEPPPLSWPSCGGGCGTRDQRRGAAAALRHAGRGGGRDGRRRPRRSRHYNPERSRCCGCCASWARGRRRGRLAVDKPGFRLCA